MDPTTTLITFMLQTTSPIQTVHLIGSWDNFTKHYPMERDIRRDHGQWRGCFSFKDIICDGDGGSSPKRTGGLKMGSTYYYYYELEDGTEIHDTSIPYTTSCPYLPGQPVNLLWVPVEVEPPRYRSASMSSMMNGDIKTMNPADKFVTPRPPPPTPKLARLNTSPSTLEKKRSARSVSPKPERSPRSPWSPRTFFGLRSAPISAVQESSHDRGRSESFGKKVQGDANISFPTLISRSEEARSVKPLSHTRDVSPQSLRRSHSREPSPLRQSIVQDISHHTTSLTIPDEIAEEEIEDDANFASQLNRISLNEKGLSTSLSPPPTSGQRSLLRLRAVTDTSKPLPQLPDQIPSSPGQLSPFHLPEAISPSLIPSPLLLHNSASASQLPRSHFSTSTVSTTVTSPTSSHFAFSETPSIYDSNDDEDLVGEAGSGDEFTYNPVAREAQDRGFQGYSLPEGEGSEMTLRKETPLSPLGQTGGRTTFGSAESFAGGNLGGIVDEVVSITALGELLSEMGYLGDAIAGK